MRLFALLAAGLLAGSVMGAPVPKGKAKEEKIDAAKLVGKWQLMKVDGIPPGGTVVKEFTTDGKMNCAIAIDSLNGTSTGTYKLDGSKLETFQKVLGVVDVDTCTSEIVKLTDTVLHIKVAGEVDEYERVKDEKKEEKKDK